MPRMFNGWDIVAHANVLYVSEHEKKRIHKIQLSDTDTFSQWSLVSKMFRISINKEGNVVVSCCDLNYIMVITPSGKWIRRIDVKAIDGTIGGLYRSIQLDNDRFIICNVHDKENYVCIINNNGRMLKCYGGEKGSGIEEMRDPAYLAIDRSAFVLVVDKSNNRIIQLNASLEFIREFVPGSVGLHSPKIMYLDEDRRRLYISEYNSERISIFDL